MTIEKTYFLGAGASKAFYPTLPLASEATLEFLLNLRGPQVSHDQAIDNLKQYIADQRWPKQRLLIPFEQIYSQFLEILEPVYHARENLKICLLRKLRIGDSAHACDLNSWLKESLSSGHPILTTNYDTVIEWHVENLFPFAPVKYEDSGILDYGVPNHLCLPSPSLCPQLDGKSNRLLLLKLYGSMGWSRCENENCGKFLLETIYERGAEEAIIGRGKCPACQGIRRNAVFVPLIEQKIANDIALQAIWKKAEQVLSESHKIVFAGFSLNPDDKSIRELLRRVFSAAHTSKVTVVLNRSHPEIIERYREIYGNRVESCESGWVQYLRGHMAGRPSRY